MSTRTFIALPEGQISVSANSAIEGRVCSRSLRDWKANTYISKKLSGGSQLCRLLAATVATFLFGYSVAVSSTVAIYTIKVLLP